MNTNLKVSKITFESLKNVGPQSGMSVTPIENMGITAEDAPYLPHIVSVGDKSLDDIASDAANATRESFETCRFWWNSMIELIASILLDGVHTEVNFGYWSFALAVEGSVPSADAQPTTLANPVYIACYPSPELNRVTEQLETKRNIAAQAFIVDQVFGCDTAKSRVVTAGEDMHVFGKRLSMGATGEKAELVKGESVYALTYLNDTVDLPTRMDFTVPSNVPAGKGYTLRVTAFGKDHPNPQVEIVEKENITVLAGAPVPGPSITKVVTDDLNDNEINQEKHSVIHGSGFGEAGSEGKQLAIELWENGSLVERCSTMESIDNWSDTEISTQDDAGLWPYGTTKPDGKWTAEGADTRLVMLDSDDEDAEVLASFPIKVVEV